MIADGQSGIEHGAGGTSEAEEAKMLSVAPVVHTAVEQSAVRLVAKESHPAANESGCCDVAAPLDANGPPLVMKHPPVFPTCSIKNESKSQRHSCK